MSHKANMMFYIQSNHVIRFGKKSLLWYENHESYEMSLQYIVKQTSVCVCAQDSGVHLSVIDDSNEHMLTVWDWQKKSKIAEIKVCGHFFHVLLFQSLFLFCSVFIGFVNGLLLLQTTNEVVLAVEFHPTDANTIVTCGKSHIFFWTWSGSSLARKQGIFGVRTHTKIVY